MGHESSFVIIQEWQREIKDTDEKASEKRQRMETFWWLPEVGRGKGQNRASN